MQHFLKFFFSAFCIHAISLATSPLKDDIKDHYPTLTTENFYKTIFIDNRDGLILLQESPLTPDQKVDIFQIDIALGDHFAQAKYITVAHFNALTLHPDQNLLPIYTTVYEAIIQKCRFSNLTVAFPFLECLISKEDCAGRLGHILIREMIEREEIHDKDAREFKEAYPNMCALLFKAFKTTPGSRHNAGSAHSEEELELPFRPITPQLPAPTFVAMQAQEESISTHSDERSQTNSDSTYYDQDASSTEPMDDMATDISGENFRDIDSPVEFL